MAFWPVGLSSLIVPGKKNALPLQMAKMMPLLFRAATPHRTRLLIPTFYVEKKKQKKKQAMGPNPHNTSDNEREITSFVLVEKVAALLFIMPPTIS